MIVCIDVPTRQVRLPVFIFVLSIPSCFEEQPYP